MNEPEIYVVVTPARTFSSLVARLLHESGVDMGMGWPMNSPDYANPHGFYEAVWSIAINDFLLGEIGASVYDTTMPTPEAVGVLVNTKQHGNLFHALRRLELAAIRNDIQAWGFKDNRICWLTELWRLPLMVYEAKLITVDRPEEAVVASMMDVWPEQYFYEEDAQRVFRESRRRVDMLMEDWMQPTLRIDGDRLFDDTDVALAELSAFIERPVSADLIDRSGRHYTGG